ncbi:MAG: hypothetical protein AB2L24_28905 [Mangrovibacterium sp.]
MKMGELIRRGISIIILATALSACQSGDRSKELGQYSYEDDDQILNESLKAKVGGWIEEGVTCYGILILQDENGLPKKLKEVKAKVVLLQSDKIKMKSLENITLAPVEGCNKLGIRKGETWWETEGDLFQSKEEAVSFIDKNYPGLRAES